MTEADKKLAEPNDTVILSVALVSGRFKTELRVPLFGGEDKAEIMGQWVDFIQTGFRIGATKMDAVLKEKDNVTGSQLSSRAGKGSRRKLEQ